ncbi:Fibroleukin, partial [Stylophora pistillata]
MAETTGEVDFDDIVCKGKELWTALRNNPTDKQRVLELLRNGAKPNFRDPDNSQIIFQIKETLEVNLNPPNPVSALLEGYINWTPLHFVVSDKEGDVELIDMLLEHGAETNFGDSYNLTPLHLAAEKGYLKTVEKLLTNPHSKADRTKRSIAGKETALDIVERKLREPLADVVDKEEEEARRKELEKVASYLRNYQTAVTVSHGGSSDVTIIPQQDHEFSLEFPSRQRSQLAYSTVRINGDKDIDAFTICLWLKPSTLGSDLGLLRYFDEAGSNVYFALRLGDVGQLWISIHGEDRELDIMPQIQYGVWHGLCVTWNKHGGHFMIYYDGRLIRSENGLKSGNSFPSNETFTLGIGAEEKFNYTGMVGHVNIWPSVLEHSLLSVLSSKCGVERGGLVSWPQFRKDLRGVDVHTKESCPFNEVQITHEENHWKLDGDDKDLNPKYSAVFLEGRLDGHKAVYLDQTMSYIEAPRLSLGTAFSITCWVKLLYSTPVYRPILSVETNSTEKFSIGFNADSQLLLDKWSQGVYNITKSYASLPANQWIHVAVTFAQEGVLSFFFDGMKNLSVAGVWQGPRSGAFEIGRYKNVSEDKHRHFHGFLSDLYVFSKNLTAEEIGRLMGRSYPCTLSEWSSDAKLTPHQTPRKKYRHKSCPGIGECKEVRKWKPADCREVLLSGCKTSAKYTISPLNNHEEFEVFCDQETQGGGWTVIQQRINGSVSFNRTWDEYKAGFGVMGVQLEMWLGNERIHSLTTQKTEILIELTAFDGTKGFAYYSHFHVAGEDLWYQLSVGGFSGNIPDKLVLHDTFNFSVTKCGAATSSSGWWFTPSCGEALLNSEYGHDTGSMMWSDFPVAGAHKGKIKKSTMKIRRTEVRPPTVPRQMNLLRYVVQDGNFSMGLKPYGKEYKIILSIWPSTRGFNKQVKYPSLDGSWRHVCTSWTNVDGRGAIYIDDTQTPFLGIGNGTKFTGGGKVVIGSTHVVEPPLLGLEITYMNLWDKVLSTVSIENLAHSCGAEAGNVLQWSLFAAMSVGNVQVVPSSACRAKEMYYWNFNQSNSLESFDGNKNHRAELTGGKISPGQKYLVIEDQGKFLAENLSSELSGENGFTVSFSAGQTVLASEILRNDFKSLEVLHRAFPDFIRDHATWKRCYFADQSSWSTAEFHTKCDYKGPTLTIVRVREYVFGGFVENSWGGKPSNIGHQIEGFLFSLSNPFDLAPRILPIQQGKASGRTNPHLGPSFGERDLELFEDKHGRIMGYSRLGASFDLMSVSLSSYEAWFYLAGSQHFYPDQVEVFYYHVPSTPLGLENQILPDNYLSNSSQLNSSSGPHLARLNEQRDSKAWCSAGPNEWLQVFLGKQYTLTHMALQSIGGGVDVTELKVQYEKTRDGIKWKYYSKEIDGKEMLKVLRFNFPSAGFVKKEAFIPPFQAVKVRFLLTETRVQCIKMELYFYDAGCSQPHGIENRTVVPDEKLTASSTEVSDEYKQGYFWPNIGRLNHDKEGAHSWGPYKHPVHLFKGIWFQVDLKEETEVTCIATQGRPTNIQWPTKYQLAYSSEGNDWKYFEDINGVKKFDANSDQHMAVTNWLVPSIYGRFFRVYITRCNIACRLRMELYGRRDPTNNIYWSKNGLSFTVRRGRYHIFFAKENHRWEIRHPLIVNQWFEATIAWKLQDGLKFYVNGNLVASDKIPVRRNFFPAKEPFKLLIASMENGGGWSRAISIDDVAVWGKAMSKEEINRKSEVHFDFDDNSRDWESLVDGTNGWTLLQGCTKTSGTGPCDDVSRGGRYIYFDAAQSKEKARFSTPSSIHSYNCLKFHYHMAGTHTGRLNVYATDIRGKEQLLWRLFGEQKNTWRKASIPVNDIHPQYQVVFEAVRGPGYLGDIALDQIAFTRESCVFSPSSAMPHNSHRSGVGQVGDNSSYDLQFWRKNSADIVKSVLPTLTPNSSFTASLWLKTSVKSTLIVFSIGQIDSFLQLRLEPAGWLSLCSKDKCNTNNGSISQVINDGCWHHVTVVWHSSSKSWTVFSDGVNRGKQTEEKWQKSTFSLSGTLFIGKEQIQGSSRFFSGRITQFNMWNHELEEKDITVLARNCANLSRTCTAVGQFTYQSPCTGLSTNYRADTKAFIFSLNYTSDGTLFKKEISKESSALATYSSPYTGPTFGESPFDFQIGIDGDLKRGTSQHSVSYKEEEDSSKSNLETVLAGASSFNVNDVEVLYRAQGASLCSNRCPFYHYCDEITGICRCRNKNPALCQLVKFYEDSSHFWLLESMDDIKDLRTPGWGQSKGGVSSFGDGLVTDGVNGEVILNHEGDTCATKSAEAHCDDSGFTVSLSLKPSYKAGGERQTFFKSRGKFVVYQERQKKSLIIRVRRSAKYCLKEIAMPEKIWSHLAFTYQPSQPRTLTVYRNGRKIDKFIRDEGCEVDGEPEFSSTSMSLGSEGGLFAKAHYYLIAIWGQVLSEERITQIYRGIQGSVPLRCRVVARIKNQLWNEDLTSPETDPYRAMTNEIISNVTRFYEGIRVTVTVNEFRNGSVIADFTIIYNVSDYKLIERLQQNISSTGFLYNMPLEVEEFTAENVPEVAPTNISVLRVEDTSIHIRWNSLSLPPSISAIFQGYKVFIRSVGRADVIVTTVTVNDLVNFVTIKGLESLVTYNLTVAGYTLSGVGRESESFSVTTPLDDPPEDISVERVTSNCVQIKWGGLPPEKLAAFDGYRVFYALFSHPTFSLNTTVNSSTHRVEICSLESSMKYKFYVQRILRKDVGNASDVKYFTTEIVMRLAPTNVTCRNTSSTSIEVHWAPPSVEVNSLEIIGYDLHFRPHGLATELWSTLLACNRTLSATIKSLEKYTEYDIRVTIFITNGRGNFSEIVRCFTDED